MATRTITVHDRCTTEGCNRVLHSVSEAVAGQCSSCWVKAMPAAKKQAMNRLLAAAFGASDVEADAAIDDAKKHLGAKS